MCSLFLGSVWGGFVVLQVILLSMSVFGMEGFFVFLFF